MMILRCLTLLSLLHTLHASVVTLECPKSAQNDETYLEYIKDVNNTINTTNVTGQKNWNALKDESVNFGFDNTPYWYRITLKNASRCSSWLLQFNQTTIDWLDVYIYDASGSLTQDLHMGDHRFMKERVKSHPTFLIPLHLEHAEAVTLYFRVQSPIHQLGFKVWEQSEFEKRDFEYRFFISLFFGVLIVIAIYNLIIYFLEKNLAFLYFVGYLVALASLQFAKLGLYHYFEITPMWFNTHIQFFSAVGIIILFTMFLREFLQTRRHSPRIDRFMRFQIALFIVLYLSQLVVSLQFALKTTFPSALSIIGVLIYFTFTSWHRGLSYRIMIFAWLSFATAALVLALSKMGVIERTFFSEHAFYFGIIIESILMSLALSNKLKEERERYIAKQATENRKLDHLVEQRDTKLRQQERMMIQQSKMAAMGEMIEAIAHQWRQPLNTTALGLAKLKLERDLGIVNIENETRVLEQIEKQINFLSHTIDDFRSFFKKDKQKEYVTISEVLHDVSELLQSVLESKNIQFRLQCSELIKLETYPNELKQVVLNMVHNAKDAIVTTQASQKWISIHAQENDASLTISVCDSGGGIDEAIIDRIFEPYFTTKFESQGTGIGLYLSKIIVEKHLAGRLEVTNKPEGACFEIVLPKG